MEWDRPSIYFLFILKNSCNPNQDIQIPLHNWYILSQEIYIRVYVQMNSNYLQSLIMKINCTYVLRNKQTHMKSLIHVCHKTILTTICRHKLEKEIANSKKSQRNRQHSTTLNIVHQHKISSSRLLKIYLSIGSSRITLLPKCLIYKKWYKRNHEKAWCQQNSSSQAR